jgi:hypothetical protein
MKRNKLLNQKGRTQIGNVQEQRTQERYLELKREAERRLLFSVCSD